MPMKNPPHPGLLVRMECIEPLGLTVTDAAKGLGVTRQALNTLREGARRREDYVGPWLAFNHVRTASSIAALALLLLALERS